MTQVPPRRTVAPPRIGSGVVFLILGGLALSFGAFALLAGAGGSAGATEIGGGATALGEMLIVVGVVFRLFSKVEARLMDIQTVILDGTEQVTPHPSTSRHEKAESMSDEALMAHYGITFEMNKYKLGEWQYDKLSDAIAYAKLA